MMINIVIVAAKTRLAGLKQYLQTDEDLSIIYATDNIAEADSYIKKAAVIVLDLDQEYTRSAVFALKDKKVPIVAITNSAPHGFTMMGWGATEMQLRTPGQQEQYFCKLLATKIKNVSKKIGGLSPRVLKWPISGRVDKIIAIGSSTGGTDTVEYILRQLPMDVPPILVVQHMPPIFTRMFAERLHSTCDISVWEARDGDPVTRGLALIAPGDYHMKLARGPEGLYVKCTTGERVCNQRPSVDVLFESIADIMGGDSNKVIGVILTGMGSDGAKGLLSLRNKGSHTIGQNEESCVVYGMPRAAHECGAVVRQLHLTEIAPAILNFVRH